MTYAHSEEQQMLVDQVASLLDDRSPPAALRKVIESGDSWNRDLWNALCELGVAGAAIPEQFGGIGLGPRELAVTMEQIGKRVAPVPFFSSICLAAEAIVLGGTEEQKARLLPRLASGELVGTLALDEGSGVQAPEDLSAQLTAGKLHAVKWPVPDGLVADTAVVVLAGGRLAIADLTGSETTRTALNGFDELRVHARIDFNAAPAELLGPDGAPRVLSRLLDRAAVYEAFEQIGGAEAAMLVARDYSSQRYIFGRTLASYQATKHKLAENLIELEVARSIALGAIDELDRTGTVPPRTAAAARIAATSCYENVSRDNLQIHGGIGFTWEADVHFHLRRARLLALNLGPVEVWSDRLVADLKAQLPATPAQESTNG